MRSARISYSRVGTCAANLTLLLTDTVQDGFTAEFDYTLEAANLRRMIDEVLPLCEREGMRVRFPRPYDQSHPNLPAIFKQRGRSLTTRRLMVMDMCDGASLSKV